MKKTILFMAVIFSSACIAESTPPMITNIDNIKFDKSLFDKCLDISKVSVEKYRNIEILKIKTILKEPAHKCGCTSETVGYQVFEKLTLDEGDVINSSLRSYGRFTPKGNKEQSFDIILSSNPKYNYTTPIEIHVNCVGPD